MSPSSTPSTSAIWGGGVRGGVAEAALGGHWGRPRGGLEVLVWSAVVVGERAAWSPSPGALSVSPNVPGRTGAHGGSGPGQRHSSAASRKVSKFHPQNCAAQGGPPPPPAILHLVCHCPSLIIQGHLAKQNTKALRQRKTAASHSVFVWKGL